MKKFTRENVVYTTTIITTVCLTSIAIYYNYYDVYTENYEPVIENWPYISIGFQLTLITVLAAKIQELTIKVEKIDKNVRNNFDDTNAVIPYWFAMTVLVLLFYPGLSNLRITSDPTMFSVMLTINTIHCCAFYILYNYQTKSKTDIPRILVLVFIITFVIFLAPQIIGLLNGTGMKHIDY